jgi:hypothetical protein
MAGSTSVDAMLADAISKLDGIGKRMDALETGEKNIIKGDDDDDDKKKGDAFPPKKADAKKADDDDDDKKDDGITAPKTKILSDDDDDDKKKGDAFPPKKAKDDSKKRGDDGELEIKHKKEDSAKKADAKKADDDDDDKKKADDDDDDKKKSDDDDDDKKDDAAKADAVTTMRRQLADQAEQIRRLSAMMRPRSDEEHVAFADAQARADAVFNGFGERAPRPLEGEDLSTYRTRLATKLKKHSVAWKGVKLSILPDEAFGIAENQIYADAASAAANPVDLEPGELREVTKTDPRTGLKTTVFYGNECFVKQMGRPGRRVASFRTLASV